MTKIIAYNRTELYFEDCRLQSESTLFSRLHNQNLLYFWRFAVKIHIIMEGKNQKMDHGKKYSSLHLWTANDSSRWNLP